jgi:Holliday junction resolvase RusA-like endonuclease
MTSYRIQIDGVIPGWQRAGHSGHHYTQAKTRDAEERIKAAALAQVGSPMIAGPVELFAKVYAPIPASWSAKKKAHAIRGEIRPTCKPDWDNVGKLISDALNGCMWKDDAQIVDGSIRLFYAERPGADILVTEISPA